jgi:HK97 gp10 family phage protein
MSATLTGDKELRAALNILPDRIYRKVVRQMTGKMATPIVSAAKRNLKAVQSEKARGVLAKGLRKKTKTYKADGSVVTIVGGKFPEAAHAHLVEFGHRMVVGGTVSRLKKQWSASRSSRTGKRGGGRVVGFVPAKPFMRPAYDATKGQAMAIAEQALRVGIEREAKKLAKL